MLCPLNSVLRSPKHGKPPIAHFRRPLNAARKSGDEICGTRISEAESAFQAFVGFRTRLDENLPKRGPEWNPEVVESFSPTITKLIDVSGNRLPLTLETLTRPPTAALAQLVSLRNLTAQMAENAGRERALLGGMIASRAKMPTNGLRTIARFRGNVELAWETISPIRMRADLPRKVANAISGVEKIISRSTA